MGCDIHSRAEVRDPETGEWSVLEPIFPYGWNSRSVNITSENIEKFTDGYLLDAVDIIISGRHEGKDYRQGAMPQIMPGSGLEQKILTFEKTMSAKLELERAKTSDERLSQNEWSKMRHETISTLGIEADLSQAERSLLCSAILDYRDEEDDYEGDDGMQYSRLYVSFSKLDDGTWLPFESEGINLTKAPLDNRNYTLFAALSDVRNQDGGVVPMEGAGNGIPDDVSAEGLKFMNGMGVDGHSHTHHTLADLKAYDLDGDVVYSGLVSETVYDLLRAKGYPDDPYVGPHSWSGGIAGGGIRTFTEAGLAKWKEKGSPFLKQPGGISFFADDIHIDAVHIPNDYSQNLAYFDLAPALRDPRETVTREEATAGQVDLWADLTPEQIAEAEKNLLEGHGFFRDNRYSYNGIKPYVLVTWQQKRRKALGKEFENMIEAFEQVVAERGLSDEDVRLLCYYDN